MYGTYSDQSTPHVMSGEDLRRTCRFERHHLVPHTHFPSCIWAPAGITRITKIYRINPTSSSSKNRLVLVALAT